MISKYLEKLFITLVTLLVMHFSVALVYAIQSCDELSGDWNFCDEGIFRGTMTFDVNNCTHIMYGGGDCQAQYECAIDLDTQTSDCVTIASHLDKYICPAGGHCCALTAHIPFDIGSHVLTSTRIEGETNCSHCSCTDCQSDPFVEDRLIELIKKECDADSNCVVDPDCVIPRPCWPDCAGTAEASVYRSKEAGNSNVLNHVAFLLIPVFAVVFLKIVRRKK